MELKTRIYTESDIRRFYTYVDVRGPDECWEWVGNAINGRANFNFDKYTVIAARFIWWFTTGIWPEELEVCHSCDNMLCVNPKHLWLGTQKDNIQDSISKGRMASSGTRGATHRGHYLLTEEEVREIREKYAAGGSTQIQLAEEYGVCDGAIHNVIRRNSFKHVM